MNGEIGDTLSDQDCTFATPTLHPTGLSEVCAIIMSQIQNFQDTNKINLTVKCKLEFTLNFITRRMR